VGWCGCGLGWLGPYGALTQEKNKIVELPLHWFFEIAP